jgi:hypothetical protein
MSATADERINTLRSNIARSRSPTGYRASGSRTGYGPRFSSGPPVVYSARRGCCSGYVFVRIFHHRGGRHGAGCGGRPQNFEQTIGGGTFSGPST